LACGRGLWQLGESWPVAVACGRVLESWPEAENFIQAMIRDC
jgi:hypothetical protein